MTLKSSILSVENSLLRSDCFLAGRNRKSEEANRKTSHNSNSFQLFRLHNDVHRPFETYPVCAREAAFYFRQEIQNLRVDWIRLHDYISLLL